MPGLNLNPCQGIQSLGSGAKWCRSSPRGARNKRAIVRMKPVQPAAPKGAVVALARDFTSCRSQAYGRASVWGSASHACTRAFHLFPRVTKPPDRLRVVPVGDAVWL